MIETNLPSRSSPRSVAEDQRSTRFTSCTVPSIGATNRQPRFAQIVVFGSTSSLRA
jgi:hypothetical protein